MDRTVRHEYKQQVAKAFGELAGLKNSLAVLRRGLMEERRSFRMVEDFPLMLRISNHSEPFSATCYRMPRWMAPNKLRLFGG
jgi:hypothetical protein